MKNYILSDSKMRAVREKLALVQSIVHYNGTGDLGVYPSAAAQLLRLVAEIGDELDRAVPALPPGGPDNRGPTPPKLRVVPGGAPLHRGSDRFGSDRILTKN